MSSDKPLHVKVAEALGWTIFAPDERFNQKSAFDNDLISYIKTPLRTRDIVGEEDGGWGGVEPRLNGNPNWMRNVPHYDTDWSATGPLIEKYQIEFEWCSNSVIAWSFLADDEFGTRGDGKTPLEATCNLILALKEAGKL